MKRTLFVLLVITGLLLSSCGGKPTPAASQPASQPTAAQAAPAEITFMAWGATEELDVWKQIVDDFQVANPTIKVNVEVADWDSYWEKLKTLFSAKTPPDVFAMDAPLYLDWQSRGVLLNLQPYLDKNPGFLDDIYPQTLQAYKLADGYYGLPRDFQTIGIFYNKDMFDAAGLPYPKTDWTMEDLRSTAKKLTLDKNNDGTIEQYGFAFDTWDMELFWSEAIWAYGGDIINADHTKTLIGDEKARAAWQFMYDMMWTDKSAPDPNTSTQYGSDLFQTGVAAMTAMGHWSVPSYAQTSTFKWDVAPMPAGPYGHFTSVNSAGFVAAKDSKYPDAAWEFIKYCLGSAGQTRLAELGLAIPVRKSIANSDVYLNQKMVSINQKVFLDALDYARTKPVFKGYEEWAAAVGDGLTPAWNGEADLNATLDEIVKAADDVLAKNK